MSNCGTKTSHTDRELNWHLLRCPALGDQDRPRPLEMAQLKYVLNELSLGWTGSVYSQPRLTPQLAESYRQNSAIGAKEVGSNEVQHLASLHSVFSRNPHRELLLPGL